MWSSWVRRKGTTQVMYIAKIKDGLKRVKKIFSIVLERVFKWYDGGGENRSTSKRILKLKCLSPLKMLTSPLFEETFRAFLFFLFLSLSLFFSATSPKNLGVSMIFEKKITSSKTSFQMALIY
jgi:hypothetical protein